MDAGVLIEDRLEAALARAASPECPPKLAKAMRHAVFPGGARVRPRLCLAVAHACGGGEMRLAATAGAAIELFHCASLVHDDLPCFDAADTRRGLASVQKEFGEALAVLAGDGLIVLGFETLALGATAKPERLAPLFAILASATGAPRGIVAGQAWESETDVNLRQYQRAKTGALFVAASMMGAVACGADPAPWRTLGDRLGEAYQVADDIADVAGSADKIGKPEGQDAAHGRPNAARELGVTGALDLLDALIADAQSSIPECDGAEALRALVRMQAERLTPKHLVRNAV
ncbi:MAG: polyprenyl synthetase family protein [Parvularculaceae bacterium]|nr:polyprenyl synthetase family protein [Parvularculaceae bacterium]